MVPIEGQLMRMAEGALERSTAWWSGGIHDGARPKVN
jgi:hypothetical protein